MEKYLLVSIKTILLFLFGFLCTAGAFAQYHKGEIGDRTKQGVAKIHQRNVDAGKRISKRMTERRQAQNKGRCKQNFRFKDLTIVASQLCTICHWRTSLISLFIHHTRMKCFLGSVLRT